MSRKVYLILIIIWVFLLPLLYDHFAFLPESVKYFLDLFIAVYFFRFRPRIINRRLESIYLLYILISAIFLCLGGIYNGSEPFDVVQMIRRMIYPFFFLIIINDYFKFYQDASLTLTKTFTIIFLVQVPVTILQKLIFTVLPMKYYDDNGSINLMDISSGTLGAGGAQPIGVLIPLAMLLFYLLNKPNRSFIMLLPLILASSGGGIILTFITLLIILFVTLFYGSLKRRIISIFFLSFFSILVVISIKTLFISEVDYWSDKYVSYGENQILGEHKNAQFVEAKHKLDRIYGHQFLLREMKNDVYKQLFGLGSSYKSTRFKGVEIQFKNDINYILAEKGFVGLYTWLFFMIIFLYESIRKTKNVTTSDRIILVSSIFIFFLGSVYAEVSRTWHLNLYIFFLWVLMNNPEQLKRLSINHKN